jgi:hypothetical protein
MFRAPFVIAASVFALATPALAASPFDGTWKIDIASAKQSQKPDVIVLKDGIYECSTCVPALKVAADGVSHPVAGRDYYDALTVTVVDPMTIRSRSTKGGITVSEGTRTISADGTTMTATYTSSNNANGTPLTNTSRMKRVAAGPAGAHAISGSWVPINEGAQIAEANLLSTFKLAGKTFSLSYPTGESYVAVLGGPKVPLKGDKAGTMVSVRMTGADTIEESTFRGGALRSVATLKVTSPTTIAMRTEDKRGGYVDDYVLIKQ